MDDPQYRFCTSSDGTRIAYAVYGSGPPLLYANAYAMSMDSQFTLPPARAFFDALAANTTLVVFDRRGTGASTRDIDDLSPEAEVCDIAAVVDAEELHEFTLFSLVALAPCARYAIEHETRVQRLILWYPRVGIGSEWDRQQARAFREDWSYARRRWAGVVYPQGPVSLQRAFSKAVKQSASAEMIARRFEQPEVDPNSLLPGVTVPTLVLQRDDAPGRKIAMRAAGLLPNGQLRFVVGDAITPYPGHEPIVAAVFDFMGLSKPAAVDVATPSGTAIILFADIADSTALTERLGDAAFREKARELDASLRRAIESNGGTAIEGKLLGDGVLAVFGAAREAIACAQACHAAADGVGLALHVGIHAGDVIREEGNVYGGAVNIAARVAGEAAAGETLVSATVRDLARTSAGVLFEDRGERELKGVGEPVRLYEVGWKEGA